MHASESASLDALLHAATQARAIRPTVPLALATLVGVEGSSFRQPGARLLVDAEGRCLAGAISGGCLEADVATRAANVCKHGQAVHLTYDLRDDLRTIWGFDAACDGIAHILVEPLDDVDWLEHAVALRQTRLPASIVVVTAAPSGGMPLGTAYLVEDEVHALRRGDVPSPQMRHAALELARVISATKRAARLECTVDGNALTLFGDPVQPPVLLHVVGAGRGAEAFARLASAMGWQVTVVDHRPALLESLQVPAGVHCHFARPEHASSLVADESSAVALLTHIFDMDRAWLEALLPMKHAYIGVLGSRARAQRLFDALSIRDAAFRVHAPIGLDLGGEDPEAMALATLAEIQAVLHGRPGGSLRERRSPIHDRTPTPVDPASRLAVIPAVCRLPE